MSIAAKKNPTSLAGTPPIHALTTIETALPPEEEIRSSLALAAQKIFRPTQARNTGILSLAIRVIPPAKEEKTLPPVVVPEKAPTPVSCKAKKTFNFIADRRKFLHPRDLVPFLQDRVLPENLALQSKEIPRNPLPASPLAQKPFVHIELDPKKDLHLQDLIIQRSTARWGEGTPLTKGVLDELMRKISFPSFDGTPPSPTPQITLPQLPPVGIRNTGNSCYANSLFQIVAATPSMFQAISENANSQLKSLLEQYEKSVKSNSVCSLNLAALLFPTAASRQQDAEEALQGLLNNGCTNPSALEQTIQRTTFSMTPYELTDAEFTDIQNVVAGRSRSVTKYNQELLDSKTIEALSKKNPMGPFLGTIFQEVQKEKSFPVLTHPINSNKSRPFIEYLSEAFASKNGFRLKEGSLEQSAIDTITCLTLRESVKFTTPPDFFILDTKRTRSDGAVAQGSLTLDNEIVPFPGACFDQQNDVRYRLTGFCRHLGVWANSGHYISFVTRLDQNNQIKYYKINDESTTEISRENFLKNFASCSIASFEKVGLTNQNPSLLPKVRPNAFVTHEKKSQKTTPPLTRFQAFQKAFGSLLSRIRTVFSRLKFFKL